MRHVIEEFGLRLDELHNDSTTVSFFGAYDNASEAGQHRGRKTLAVTFGHSKARRPDLKQLLYILTVTGDGGVPIYFTSDSGNVTDDTTHRQTWDLLCDLVGRPDFLYVADCKLATRENMQYLHNRGGRFVTILPRTRREDAQFRERLLAEGDGVAWEHLVDVTNKEDEVVDRFRVCRDAGVSVEGFRLLWFHSTRKVARDLAARADAIDRTQQELAKLRERLQLPRTRFRDRAKVEQAVDEILDRRGTTGWVRVEIQQRQEATFKQAQRGRPGAETQYVRQLAMRYRLSISIDQKQLAEEERTDGLFPLISNVPEMSPEALLRAYKRQPLIEKRPKQFKNGRSSRPTSRWRRFI